MSPLLIVLIIHSMVRWLIVLLAIIGVVKFGIGMAQRQSFDKMSRGVLMGYSGLMDLQGLIGLVFLLWSGFATNAWPMYRFVHLALMLIAIVVGHLPARLKASSDAEKHRNALVAIIVSMILVVIGVAVLGGNRWDFG